MMEWGIKKADELGLPAYVEATDNGYELYKEYGFKVESEMSLDATMETPSEGFTKVREELGCPIHGWFMRRPKDGKTG
jgi:hypothetical protein